MTVKSPANTDTPEPSIRMLLLSSQEGDTGAFQKLVETYQGYAYSLAIRFLGNGEDAGDVVQETFIRIWKHLSTFDFRCKFTTWMYRIVANLCQDRLKIRDRRNRILLQHAAEYSAPDVSDHNEPEDKNIKKELADIITAFAAELAPRQRDVFVLRDLQNTSVGETAQILGMSTNAVKSNLSHARRNIRQRLEQLEQKGRVYNET